MYTSVMNSDNKQFLITILL